MDQSASNSKGGPLGGMDLFSLFRIDSNLREKAEAKLEEAARKHTAELTEEYNARIDYLKSLGSFRKPDMVTLGEMRRERLCRPPVHGRIPGVQLGIELGGKVPFAILGIHDNPISGISTPNGGSQEFKKGAYCVAVGTDYRNEDCKDVIIYEGMNTKGKQNDQDPGKPENVALVNNMNSQTPVRVIKKIQEAPALKWKYLGLYDVVSCDIVEEEVEESNKKRKKEAVAQPEPEAPGVPKKRKVIKFKLCRNKANSFENNTPTLSYRPHCEQPHRNPLSKLKDKLKKRINQAGPSHPPRPSAASRLGAAGAPKEPPLPSSEGAAGTASAAHQGRQGGGLEGAAAEDPVLTDTARHLSERASVMEPSLSEQQGYASAVWADLNSPARPGDDSSRGEPELIRSPILHAGTSPDPKDPSLVSKAAAQEALHSSRRDKTRLHVQQDAAAAAQEGADGDAEPSSPGSPGPQNLAAKAAAQQAKAAAQQAKAAAQEAPGDVQRDKARRHGAPVVPPAEALPSSGSPGPQDWAAKAAAQQAKAAAQEAPGDAPRDEAHLNAQQGAATAAEPGASRADEVPPAEALPSSGSPGPQELRGAVGGGGQALLNSGLALPLLPQAAKAAAQQAAAARQAAAAHPGSSAAPPPQGTTASRLATRAEASHRDEDHQQQQQQPPLSKADLAKKAARQEAASRSSEQQPSSASPAREEGGDGPEDATPSGVLLEDISGGKEPNVKIPVINTVDDDRIPEFTYIAESEFSSEELKERIYRASVSSDKLFVPFPTEPIFIEASEAFEAKPGAEYPVLSTKAWSAYVNEVNMPPEHKVLSKGLQLPLEVFKTEGKGWGVRCREPIPRGTFICQYAGEVITKEEADNREDSYLFDLDSFTNLMDANIEAHEKTMGCAIDPTTKADIMKRCQASQDPLVIDCRRKGGVARFINHSKFRYNCATTPAIIKRNHSTLFYSLCIFSVHDIQAGEEITYDYGLDTAANPQDVMPDWCVEFNAREEAETNAEREEAAKAAKPQKKRKKRRRN